MNSRLKENESFINSIKTEKEYEKELAKKLEDFKKKYSKELENYESVLSLKKLYNLKSAGYIRYIDLNGNLKYGGILLKIFKSENEDEFNIRNLILLKNIDNKKWTISWEKNYIFYKNQTKKGDNLRNLFISLLDKKID